MFYILAAAVLFWIPFMILSLCAAVDRREARLDAKTKANKEQKS